MLRIVALLDALPIFTVNVKLFGPGNGFGKSAGSLTIMNDASSPATPVIVHTCSIGSGLA